MSTRRAPSAQSAQPSNVSIARQQLADCAAVAQAWDVQERAARLRTAAPYPKTAGTAMQQANDTPANQAANQARGEIQQLLVDEELRATYQDITVYQMELMSKIEGVVDKYLAALLDRSSQILFLNAVYNGDPLPRDWAMGQGLEFLSELISIKAQSAASMMRKNAEMAGQ